MARFQLTATLLPKPRRAAPTAPANLSSLIPPPRSSLTTSTPPAEMAVTALDDNQRTFATSDLLGSNRHTCDRGSWPRCKGAEYQAHQDQTFHLHVSLRRRSYHGRIHL